MESKRTEFAFEAVAAGVTTESPPYASHDDAPHSPSATESPGPDDPARRQARVTMLSRVLRVIGAIVVAASAGTFLFQRWDAGSDLTRYFALLAQAGVLSAAGFFCAVRLSEGRSARTFQALAAGMVPALFAILGGLVYSQWSLDGPFTTLASYATWVAPSGFAALATAAVTVVVTIPIALLAFMSLARSDARVATAAFVGANLAVLVPTRHPAAMAGLVAAGFVGLGWLELRRFQASTAMRTREGLLVRGMLALPFVLVIARSLVHYELSLYMASILSFAIAGLFFAFAHMQRAGSSAAPFELGGLVPLAVGWMSFSIATERAFGLGDGLVLPLAALPFAISTQLLALFARRDNAVTLRTLGVVLALGAMGWNLFLAHGVLPLFLALVTGIAGVVHGFLFERKVVMAMGGLVGAAALVGHVVRAIDLYAHFNWTSLSLLGIAVIFGASLLERHHASLSKSLDRMRLRVRGDEEVA